MKRSLFVALAVFALSALAAKAADSSKVTGYISDSMCAAKHAGTGAACVKKCIEGGMKPVFVDDAKKAVWTIENPDAVKDFYGEHVTVTATADSAKREMKVEAIVIKQ